MKKFTLLLIVVVLSLPSLSATWKWEADVVNGIIGDLTDVRGLTLGGSIFIGPAFNVSHTWVWGDMVIYDNDGTLYIKQADRSMVAPIPVHETHWFLALYGDVIMADTVGDKVRVPLCDFYDHSKSGGVELTTPEDFYLAFVSPSENASDGVVRYGWMHISTDANMRFSLLDSGIGLYGEGVIVGKGTIPEPSGGMLMVLGMAVLVLRRRMSA